MYIFTAIFTISYKHLTVFSSSSAAEFNYYIEHLKHKITAYIELIENNDVIKHLNSHYTKSLVVLRIILLK